MAEMQTITAEVYFNSIKVRLELESFVLVVPCLLFQFHKGTIRTSDKHFRTFLKVISIP